MKQKSDLQLYAETGNNNNNNNNNSVFCLIVCLFICMSSSMHV